MTSHPPALVRFTRELRRRRVFTTAGLYIVGAWLLLQVADVVFPGWEIPDAGINVLLIAATVGFPLALVFGWLFNITAQGLRRTVPAGPEGVVEPRPLKGNDYLILATLVLTAVVIISYATVEILALQGVEPGPVLEKLPNSVAVLPFDNISTDPENEVFSEGVSEEIRNRLGQYGNLRVIARTSSFQFKGSDYSVSRISDLLGVRYLVKGSVRRQGDRIRVSAQLLADQGVQLWSKNYDRVLEDLFAIQDEIAGLVAAEVAPQVGSPRQVGYRPSLVAYEHFLAGRDLLYRREVVAAGEELALAIELDPDYAEAQAEYAISLLIGSPDEQALRKANAAIEAALTLAPELPRALAARGLFLSQKFPPEPVAAEAALRRALRGDPNMVDAMNWLLNPLFLQGRQEEADEWLEKAFALDPLNTAIAVNMANQARQEGRPDRAESILRRLIDLPGPPGMAFEPLCDFYIESGRLVEATDIAKRQLLSDLIVRRCVVRSYAILGMFQSVEYLNERAIRQWAEWSWVRGGLIQAMKYYWKGEYAQAAKAMRDALTTNGISLDDLDPVFAFLYGTNQALAGDSPGAIVTLEGALLRDGNPAMFFPADGSKLNPGQALAWAYLQLGMSDDARRLLDNQERWFVDYRGSGEVVESGYLYEAALTALLMGDRELSLERLEQAVASGWRLYYIKHQDPRWAALKDDPRYQALIAKVKEDVDRQRAEVEKIDAKEDFPRSLDRALDSKKPMAVEDSGEG